MCNLNLRVKWAPINRKDVPKKVKHVAIAPLVAMFEGPSRVVTVASSVTEMLNTLLAFKGIYTRLAEEMKSKSQILYLQHGYYQSVRLF